MPYASRDKQRAYAREWARKRRSGNKDSTTGGFEPSDEWRLDTIEDLKAVLEYTINELMPSDLDIGVKARVCAQLLTVGLKMIEISELSARMEVVEDRLGISTWIEK